MNRQDRREMAYWLTLAFKLGGEARRSINGLVLTADRKTGRGILELVQLEQEQRPPEIARYGETLDRLIAAEGKVSAQAFVVDRMLSLGCNVIPITDSKYPAHLARNVGPDRAPTVLSYAGDPELWSTPGVAISGSRKAGASGLAFARVAAQAVARAGQVVVCGLAAGIDRAALEGALDAGGRVLGIAPEGLLHSRWTRRAEIGSGRLTVVSEFAPDDTWSGGRAMTRNRTIAGFSSALVIADCVASGGTTDQLEVHRAAGLPVYVRRGAGQGALVDELCRRPGVTPWFWNEGPVDWPPTMPPPQAAGERTFITCVVTIDESRLKIDVAAPCSTPLDAVLAAIQAEYARQLLPSIVATGGSSAVISEESATYSAAVPDVIRASLTAAGASGITTKDLEKSTGLSTNRVRKRLHELQDAGLARRSGHKYFDAKSPAVETPSWARRRGKKRASPEEPTLFSKSDLPSEPGPSRA